MTMQSQRVRRLVGRSFILALCLCAHAPRAAAQMALQLNYDEPNGSTSVQDQVSRGQLAVHVKNNPPERVPGVHGNAFRSDGFSTWVSGSFTTPIGSQMTIQSWVALESYPSDTEQPYDALTPSSIMYQQSGANGFNIGINTYGEWWFTANINGQQYTVKAPKRFPLYEWVHVAAVIDGAGGQLRLYLMDKTGVQEASTPIPLGGQFNEASSAPLVIGKANVDKVDGVFLVNALNAAYDDTEIYTVARDRATLLGEYTAAINGASPALEQALQVTSLRFADDVLRPRYHAMPPANWTNEPHGLVEHNGKYHMFYQRTPNGPFKWQMHWGHMVSADLVKWTNMSDALFPEMNNREAQNGKTGQGSKGIWSGDVVSVDGSAYAFFTTVNFGGPFDPGIARATSSDANLETWTKSSTGLIDKNAEGYVADFRDPFVWKDGTTWHMIIGAAMGGSGGLEHYTTQNIAGGWTRAAASFSTASFASMDIGSAIWEMPVFGKVGTVNGQDKYVLVVSPIGGTISKVNPPYTRSVYWTGTWNGNQFTPDYLTPKNLDLIHGHLSPTVVRRSDGNLAAIGIVDERSSSQMQEKLGWAHTYSAPRQWTLLADGRTLGQAPVPELATLRTAGSQQTVTNVDVNGENRLAASGNQIEIIAQVDPNATGSQYGLMIGANPDKSEVTRIYYDNGSIVIDKSRSSVNFENEELTLLRGSYDEAAFGKPRKFHIFYDHSVIDVFINDKAAFSNRIYPTSTDAAGNSISTGVILYSAGGTTRFTSVDVWQITSPNGDGGPQLPVAVESLDLPASVSVGQGNQVTVNATIAPSNATNKSITWRSSAANIATVSSTGVISGVAPGSATITATSVDNPDAHDGMTVTVAAQQIYDFDTLAGWTATGDAFSAGDISTDSTYWGGAFNQHGASHLWSYKEGGDAQTGELRSDTFTLAGDGQINFLISGGNNIDQLYLALVRASDGVELLKVTGNDSEAYVARSFDARAYIGQRLFLKLVDRSTGGFGHINLDYVRIPMGGTVAVAGITVLPEQLSLAVSASASLNVSVSPPDATNQAVTWASSNPSIATVNSSGLVTGVAAGTATITVTSQDGGLSDTTAVTVSAAPAQLVYDFDNGLAGWTPTGAAFSAADVAADTSFWGGPFNQHGAHHLWSFKDGGDTQTGELRSDSFTLSGDGQINFLISGGNNINELYLALVRASDGVELLKVTGNDSEAYVARSFDARAYIGQRLFLKLVDRSTGGFGHINLDYVRIPTGGTVAVTAVSVFPEQLSLAVSASASLNAWVDPVDATNQAVTWVSSNPSIATVNSSGVVTGVAAGTATVTVTSQDGGLSDTTAVTVSAAPTQLTYDFDNGLSGWTATGAAFSGADVATDTSFWGGPFNQHGAHHLWGFKDGGDAQTGELRSDTFTLGGNGRIDFLIGGGNNINDLYLAVVRASDNVELLKVTGADTEAYGERSFDCSAYIGQRLYLKLVDRATGGFGHLNLDYVRVPVR
jgi:sucrose-6-phosphate hydrolase SacC (GH32 family)